MNEHERGRRLADAGFTARDKRLACDECGGLFTAQMLPIHKCHGAAAYSDIVSDGGLGPRNKAAPAYVPLSDEQIAKTWGEARYESADLLEWHSFARAIESLVVARMKGTP